MQSDYNFKICVVGSKSMGKSVLIHKYVFAQYLGTIKPTILNDFCKKEIVLMNEKNVNLQIWDIAGEQRFAQLTGLYTKNAHGFLIVSQAEKQNNQDFQRDVLKWQSILIKSLGIKCIEQLDIPMILVMSKCDLIDKSNPKPFQRIQYLQQFAKNNGFIKALQVSSKKNINVQQCFRVISQQMMIRKQYLVVQTPKSSKIKIPKETSKSKIKLESTKKSQVKKKSCF